MVSDSEKHRHPIVVKSTKRAGKIIITSQNPAESASETFHPGSYIEWWFIHGSFEGKRCGRRYLMASLFRYDRLKTNNPDSVGYYLLLSLLDPATGRTDIISRGERAIIERMFSPIQSRRSTNIDPLILEAYIDELRSDGPASPVTLEEEKVSVTEEPFSLAWKDFSFSQEGGRFRLAFTLPGTGTRCRIALDLVSQRHEMHGIGASLSQPMAYATIPRLRLEGLLGDEEISGTAWFDHQWGSACWFLTQPSGGKLNGWDWVAINGDDGSDWIFLLFHDMKSRKILGRYAIRFEPGEEPAVFQEVKATPIRFWESERTHITYPVGWILKIPEISAVITIDPVTVDQEIPVLGFMRAVWEGAATASGTVNNRPFTGRARLELQGYGYIFDFREYIGPYVRRIHEDIGTFFPATIDEERYRELAGAPSWLHELAACNETITRPFWDMMSRKKKYWRPVFGMLLLETLGASMEQYRMLLAVVPELIHTGTLIIDDIEDNATSRRGDTCIHKRYGLDVAINAANMLYVLPAALYSTHPGLTDAQRLAFYQITHDGYVRGHLGQALDIYWTKNLSLRSLESWQTDRLPEKMLQMYEFKTASPAIVIAEACCILAGSDDTIRIACRNLARSFGVAFQIQNDVRDFDDGNNGRRCGEDLESGKLTYVIVRAMELLTGDDRKRLEKIVCSPRLRRNPESLLEGIGLVRKSGALGSCRDEARSMIEDAWCSFSPIISPSEHKLMLRLFSKNLVNDGRNNHERRGT